MIKRLRAYLVVAVVLIVSLLVYTAQPAIVLAATSKLIGTDTQYSNNSASAYIEIIKQTASVTGSVTEFHIYSAVAGNVKIGIYADNAGVPDAQLSVNNAGTAVSAGVWNVVSITATPITSGAVYWLAILTDTYGCHVQDNAGTYAVKCKSSAYAGGLPSPAGAGYSNSTIFFSIAGYGIYFPTVTSAVASDITATTATANGNITDTGGENCAHRGVVYDTVSRAQPGNVVPAASGYAHNVDQSGSYPAGAFTESLTSLTPSTTYYYRMYASNTAGYTYSTTEQTFATLASPLPSVTTQAVLNIEETTATYNGTITSGTNIDQRGFAWGTTSNSTVTPGNEVPPASYTTNWTDYGAFGTGNFAYNASGLTSADEYYVRAYSHNATGWGWGGEVSFFTKPNEPTALTCTPGDTQSALTWTKATNGIGATMNTYIRYKIGSYPVDITDGTFSYNGTLSANTTGGLVNGTTYYFVLWSWAYEGTLSQWSDLTANCTCTPMGGVAVETHYCSGYSETTAVLNGEVTNLLGNPSVSERGFDYGLTTGYGSSQTTVGTFGVGEFNESINSLQPATLYHFRARAKSNAGIWAYGADMLFATKGSPTLDEYWDTGGDAYGANITGATWAYQTFTTNSTDVSHSITSIKLSLLRVGNPGTITVSVRHTSNCTTPSCYCWPTGADIVSATLDGDSFNTSYTWQEFIFTTNTCFEADTTYAIVVQAVNGDSTNYIRWYWDAGGGYGGGNAGNSTDSGVTWATGCPADYLFEVWGNSCLELEEARVFTSYINNGDWLITVLYKNFYPPYYENGADVSSLFYIQLVDGTTVKAQSKVPEWGYRPGCIYLSSTMVTSLEWGKAYLVRIYGNFGSNPHMDYTLQPTDWMGADLTRLDSWVRSVATRMEVYYSVTLTQFISGKGIVLNEDGGVIFATNIPDLDKIRPNLFTIVSTTPGYETGDHTQTYARSLAWQTLVGAQLTRMWTSIGNAFGMSGSSVGTILVFVFYAGVAFMCFPPGHAIAAVVIPIPILLFVWGTGLAQLALMAIILAVAIILFTWQFWWRGA
jgi:hypothetical protein